MGEIELTSIAIAATPFAILVVLLIMIRTVLSIWK